LPPNGITPPIKLNITFNSISPAPGTSWCFLVAIHTANWEECCSKEMCITIPDCNCQEDTDGDGTHDCFDGCPDDPNKVAPGQCGCGVLDSDADGDGIADCHDNCVQVANPDQSD